MHHDNYYKHLNYSCLHQFEHQYPVLAFLVIEIACENGLTILRFRRISEVYQHIWIPTPSISSCPICRIHHSVSNFVGKPHATVVQPLARRLCVSSCGAYYTAVVTVWAKR